MTDKDTFEDINSEFNRIAAENHRLSVQACDNQIETVKMLAASSVADELKAQPMTGNVIAKSYNLMRLKVGGPMIPEDTPSSTEAIKYRSGSTDADNPKDNRISKTYELMRMFGAR
jgi:hypothetical protein